MSKVKKKNSEYWKKRFGVLEDASNAYGQEAFRKIEPAFDVAQRQIQAEIEAWYGRFAKNNQITMQEAKKLLTAAELKEFRWDVKEYIRYGRENDLNHLWMKELENASAKFHISRLEALKIRTQQAAEVAFGNELDVVDALARKVFTEDYYHSIFEIQRGFNVGWEIGQIDERKLEKLVAKPWAADGKHFSERIWESRTQLVSELHNQLTRTCILGKAPDDAIKAISKKFNTSKNQAGRLVMTEQAYFHSEAQKEAFNDLDVEEFEIVATLDKDTSEICQEMDGKHFPMKDYEAGVTAPPFHPWCRSVTVPWFEDNYTGKRAARGEDGKTYYVPDNMKYADWKKSMVDGQTADLKVVDESGIIKENTPLTLNDCQTTDDVVSLFKQHGEWFYEMDSGGKIIKSVDGITLDGVDLECAKAVYRPFEQVFEKFPQLKGQLNAVNSAKLSGSTMAQCFFGLGHGGITVNTSYYGSVERLTKALIDSEATGFHPKGVLSIDSVVMHELGHAIDDWLTYTKFASGVNGWKPKIVSADLRPKVMKACGLKIADIYKEVSGYATKDAQEWFAECFAEYMCSDNPRPVAKKFGEMLEDVLKGVQ